MNNGGDMNKKTAKPTCVFPIKKDGKIYRYMVRTIINRESFYIGCFKTEQSATEAYQRFTETKAYKDAVARGRY